MIVKIIAYNVISSILTILNDAKASDKKEVKVEMTEFDTIFIKINGCKTKQTTYPANGEDIKIS